MDDVTGELPRDDKGDLVLKEKNERGEWIDKKKRKVNGKGYLVDNEGNVINKKGKIMFDKTALDGEDIPKLFRTGLLRSDSTSSLSRLMVEIGKEADSDFDDEALIQNELTKLRQAPSTGGGDTSVESLMEDTPSNYNIANARVFGKEKNTENAEEGGSPGRKKVGGQSKGNSRKSSPGKSPGRKEKKKVRGIGAAVVAGGVAIGATAGMLA